MLPLHYKAVCLRRAETKPATTVLATEKMNQNDETVMKRRISTAGLAVELGKMPVVRQFRGMFDLTRYDGRTPHRCCGDSGVTRRDRCDFPDRKQKTAEA